MRIVVNGETRELRAGATVAELLEDLRLGGRLAIELNAEILPRSRHAERVLTEGDRLEIIRAVGGG